jgi:metallophosphoesterase superfamily enzyme
VHHPKPARGGFTWAGHVHPVVSLRRGGDALRLPCFCVGKKMAVMPAFSRFTGGCAVECTQGERVFAVAEGGVLEL